MSGFDPRRALSIARKEVRHLLRDPFTLALAFGLPVLLVVFFGYAIDLETRDIGLTVQDRDHSRRSRELVDVFSSSGYFDVLAPTDPGRLLKDLDGERAAAVLIIEPRFGRDLASGRGSSAQFILDGADNNRASAVLGYLPGILAAARERLPDEPPPAPPALGGPTGPSDVAPSTGGSGAAPPVSLATRFLYNPELNSRWFIIPGLCVVVMGLLSIMLTALTVAREWENGSMELLLSTPVRPLEIIAGKLLPYMALCLFDVAVVYLLSRLVFGVPFRGSHLLFGLASLVFLAVCLAWGIVISVATRQQQISMQISIVTGLLPSFLLSGFIFPIQSMPVFFQYFTSLLPQKWYMVVTRGVFLKGSGAVELWVPFAALLSMAAVLITAAVKRFKTDLEP